MTKKRLPLLLLVISLFAVIMIPSICLADAVKIFKENNRAVVIIVVYGETGTAISQGSGFIVSPDGVIVTNYHVVSNASSIRVKAGNKVLNVVELIFLDKENDIAILKVAGKNLPTVKLGNLAKTGIGEKVYVIGSPEGFENTISDGILSGKREMTSNKMILQITAPISHGSSGGPVFNQNGEVIGIATAFLKDGQNINFARPIDVIRNKLSIKKGTVLEKSKIGDYENTAEYWLNLGIAYAQSGKYDEAISAYKRAILINPDYASAYAVLGLAYSSLGRNQEAIESLKQAIRINPYAQAYYVLGVTYGNLERYEEAIDSSKQAIRLKPDYAEAYFILGLSYSSLNRYEEAIDPFKQAIRINPDYAEAYVHLGLSYGGLGRNQEAIESCMQAIRITPDDAEAYKVLGWVYGRLNRNEEAIESYKKAIRINPNDGEAYRALGVTYGGLNRFREAIESLKQAVRINPYDAKAHYVLGIAYLQLGDSTAAKDQYGVLRNLDNNLAKKLYNSIYK